MTLAHLVHPDTDTALAVLGVTLVLVHVMRSHRPPGVALGWVLLLVTLPFPGIVLYLTFGTRKLRRPRRATRSAGVSERHDSIGRLLDSHGVPAGEAGNRVTVHRDAGHARRALDDIIDTAHRQIDACFYQVDASAASLHWLERLGDAATAGIRVRLLVDAVGSWRLPDSVTRRLTSRGVKLVRFNPLLHRPFRSRSNLRNHRKLVVVDNVAAWTGGRNLAAPYFDSDDWIDLTVSLHGPAATKLKQVFEHDWAFATGQPVSAGDDADIRRHANDGLRVVTSGPEVADDPLHDLLTAAIHGAQDRIVAITPYYVPDPCVQLALCLAARRGVRVELIMPRQSNHPIADIARARFVRELTQCGATVRFSTGRMLHAKLLLVDDALALTGSANLDLRSLFFNHEITLVHRSPPEIEDLQAWAHALRQSTSIHHPSSVSWGRDILEGMVLLFAYQL